MNRQLCKQHDIMEDTIDINPDESRSIFYCQKCLMTFTVKTIYDELCVEMKSCDKPLVFRNNVISNFRLLEMLNQIAIDCVHFRNGENITYYLNMRSFLQYRIQDRTLFLD